MSATAMEPAGWLLILIGLLRLSVDGSTELWTQMLVKYQPTFVGVGISGFWGIPSTYLPAIVSGWVPVVSQLPPQLGVRALASSADDLAFTPLYSSNRLVGFNLAVPVQDVYESIPHEVHPVTPGSANEIVQLRSRYYLQSSALFESPADLRSGRMDGARGLWLRNTSDPSGYTQVPTDLDELVEKTLYGEQGCMYNMGTHYYHNLSGDASCEQFHPWSMLGHNGSVVGVAWQIFGTPRVYGRDWYDKIPSPQVRSHGEALRGAAPGAPACHHRWAEQHGLYSIHVYFVSEPWTIVC